MTTKHWNATSSQSNTTQKTFKSINTKVIFCKNVIDFMKNKKNPLMKINSIQREQKSY